MYQKKVYELSDEQNALIKECMRTPWFQAILKMAEWEYIEWCKYVSSLIPHLSLMNEDDKKTLEKENDVVTAVNEFFDRLKFLDVPYYWEQINEKS